MSMIFYAYAREQVREFNWLRVIGDAPGKGAILSFEAEGMHAHDLATILDREGVAVRAGHHCAQLLMERFGVASTTPRQFRALQHPRRCGCADRGACTRRGRFWVSHGSFAARTLSGSDPRSFPPSAPFRGAGTRHPQGGGLQSAVRRQGEGHAGAGRGWPRRRHQIHGKGCAISQASASLMTEMLAGRTLEEARKADGWFPASGEGRGCARTCRPTTANIWT